MKSEKSISTPWFESDASQKIYEKVVEFVCKLYAVLVERQVLSIFRLKELTFGLEAVSCPGNFTTKSSPKIMFGF